MAPALLFLVALAVRSALGVAFPDPAYPDAYYYANVARTLAEGGGFSVDYIWSFVDVGGRIPEVATLPIPANAHWMPLAVVVQLPFLWLLGPGPVAHGLPFWLLGAAVAPVTWWIARDAGLGKPGAIAAGLLVIAPGVLTAYLGQPDNFAPYMLLGALSLWACGRAMHGDRRAFLAGAACVGLAYLSRNDGVLLALPFAVAALAGARGWLGARSVGLPTVIAGAVLCLLIVAPWLARQLVVFGSLAPSAANGRILWITDYAQLYAVSGETSVATFLTQGLDALVASRVGGFLAAGALLIGGPFLVVLAPFVTIGIAARRRDLRFLPWLVYLVVLLLASGLLFAVHVPYGTFLHSVGAVVPHGMVLAIIGIGELVAAIGRRRPTWHVPRAASVITLSVTLIFLAVSAAGAAGTIGRWRAEAESREAIVAALRALPDDARLMSPDAGAYRYHAGRTGVVTPDDPLPVIEEAARRYGIGWLAVERRHLVHALAPLLDGGERPAWLAPPIVATEDLALFPVCEKPEDPRCVP